MSGEETLLVVNNVRHKKQDGSIVMTKTRFAWFREGYSSEMTVNLPYLSIKSHKISKEGSSSVQMQLVLSDSSTYNFHYTGSDPKKARSRVSEQLVQCISKANAVQVNNPELEAKWRLLQDADLYTLYKDMVVSGIITAEEFWANHQKSNYDQQQRSGLPSAFLVDIEAVSGCNTVQYQLSTDIIENIFRTYPTVKEKHSQLVPDKLTEEQFWVQFFQSHKFHRNRLPQSSSGGQSSSSMFHECIEQDITAIKDKPKTDDGLLIHESDAPLEDVILEDSVLKVDKELLQRCNQHSALVLNAIRSDEAAGNASQTPENRNGSSLQLAIGPAHMIADTPPTDLVSLASHYLYTASQESQQTPVLLPSQAQSASKHLMVGGSLVNMDSSAAVSSISPSSFESLCRYQRSLGELLRHFWACFPVVNQQLEQKVHRMAQCIQDFRDKQLLNEFKLQLTSDSEEKLLGQLLLLIDAAMDRYHDWMSKQR
ncbi:PREDICTED: general transcription factor IIH subunit 1-like isoform X2 [Amphimedon queenslandica]|uniref:BSD domain-containing protein n=1 Tax=Amphimedon queenslandica TaxID=400682 RepID=A0A1X7V2V1_AMPQE|nr:PREDICTED: general transcription factor IIH subunit 1-like isoform X2 [Amphimedon queenslandica]|eukprot:XP_011403343.1 PREDICTED: general transcription factor IIH subunit 1-like isoform X2 [Amphimedon queenslandica]